jgi:hypothetical protein
MVYRYWNIQPSEFEEICWQSAIFKVFYVYQVVSGFDTVGLLYPISVKISHVSVSFNWEKPIVMS